MPSTRIPPSNPATVPSVDAEEAIEATRAGRGRLLLLIGAAGAGKTHRARRFAESAGEAGFSTSWTVCGHAGAPGFWPWRQMLRTLPTELVEARTQVERLVSAAEAEPTAARDLRDRFALFEDVVALLTEATRTRPMFVAFDDLHDADAASLLLLQHVAPFVRSMPLLLVATVRTDLEPTRPEWPTAWAELVRHGEVVTVGPLHADQVGALLAEATGSADAALVDRIMRRTGGNALFACELIRLYAGSGGEVDALPETVRAVIGARLAELSADCRRVISLAAAIGTTAQLDQLVGVLGEPLGEVLAGIDEAVRFGLLAAPDGDRVAFVHEIVRDAVYEALPAAHRAHWHLAIADRLAASGIAADAAHHYRLAGPDARSAAADWFVRAGEQSLAMLAYEDAATQFAAALDCGPDDPGRVNLRLGAARLAIGDAAGARAAYLVAAESGRRMSDADVLADAALGLGAGPAGFEVPLFDRAQITALEDALQLVGTGMPGVRAALLARLSIALTFTAEERRAALAAEAVELARAGGDRAALAVALAAQVDVLAGPEHAERRRAMTAEVVDLATVLHDAPLELLGRRQRIVALFELGDVTGADADIREYKAVAAALHQPLYSWYVPLWYAALALARGELDDAATRLAEAHAAGVAAGSANAQMLIMGHRFVRGVELADRAALAEIFAEFTLDESAGPWVPITLALRHAVEGDRSAALARLDAAADRLPALPRDSEWLATITQAAEAVQLVGGHPVARWLYDELLPYAPLHAVEGIGAMLRGSVERHLGVLAALLGERATAEGHFARAIEANRRIGARLCVARTLEDAGTVLGDADRSAAARALYAAIGVPHRLGASEPRADDENVFSRDGDVWTLTFGGRRSTLRDSKGLRDLAVLLAVPGRPVPAIELATTYAPTTMRRDEDAELTEPGDVGEVLDERARRAYRDRLHELDAQAVDADAAGDAERSARIAVERDALVAQLSSAYGLAGRPRRAGSAVERARSTVTARIRESIKRIEAVHPSLGRHLAAAVRTGTLCSYEPERPVAWRLT